MSVFGCVRELLAAPLEEATELLKDRLPVPKLLQCDQGGSQVLKCMFALLLLLCLSMARVWHCGFTLYEAVTGHILLYRAHRLCCRGLIFQETIQADR